MSDDVLIFSGAEQRKIRKFTPKTKKAPESAPFPSFENSNYGHNQGGSSIPSSEWYKHSSNMESLSRKPIPSSNVDEVAFVLSSFSISPKGPQLKADGKVASDIPSQHTHDPPDFSFAESSALYNLRNFMPKVREGESAKSSLSQLVGSNSNVNRELFTDLEAVISRMSSSSEPDKGVFRPAPPSAPENSKASFVSPLQTATNSSEFSTPPVSNIPVSKAKVFKYKVRATETTAATSPGSEKVKVINTGYSGRGNHSSEGITPDDLPDTRASAPIYTESSTSAFSTVHPPLYPNRTRSQRSSSDAYSIPIQQFQSEINITAAKPTVEVTSEPSETSTEPTGIPPVGSSASRRNRRLQSGSGINNLEMKFGSLKKPSEAESYEPQPSDSVPKPTAPNNSSKEMPDDEIFSFNRANSMANGPEATEGDKDDDNDLFDNLQAVPTTEDRQKSSDIATDALTEGGISVERRPSATLEGDSGTRRAVPEPAEKTPLQRAEKYKELGNHAYRQGRLADAVQFYTNSIEAYPTNPSYYGNRAACYWSLVKYDECLKDSLDAIKLNSQYCKGHARAGRVYLQKGSLKEAREHLTTALRIDPTLPITSDLTLLTTVEGIFQSYQTFMESHQFTHAAAKAKTSVKLLPNALLCKIMLVNSLMHSKPRDAMHLAQKLHKAHPTDPEVFMAIANCNFYQNAVSDAINVLSLYRSTSSSDKSANVKRDNEEGRTSPNSKEAELQTLLTDLKLFESEKAKANTLFQDGRWREAHMKYTKLLSIRCVQQNRNVLAVLHCNRAAAAKELGMYMEAVTDCTTAIRFNPQYVRPYLRRARLYLQKQNYEAGITDFETALQLQYTPDVDRELAQAKHERWRSNFSSNSNSASASSNPSSSGGSSGSTSSTSSSNGYRGAAPESSGTNSANNGNANMGGSYRYRAHSTDGRRPASAPAKEEPNYYQILGVSRQVALADLKKAFRTLALKYHPDKWCANNNTAADTASAADGTEVKDKAEAEKKFKVINEAYATLSDPKKRQDYDRTLKGNIQWKCDDSLGRNSNSMYNFSTTFRWAHTHHHSHHAQK